MGSGEVRKLDAEKRDGERIVVVCAGVMPKVAHPGARDRMCATKRWSAAFLIVGSGNHSGPVGACSSSLLGIGTDASDRVACERVPERDATWPSGLAADGVIMRRRDEEKVGQVGNTARR
jgi:hypothetical protein